TDVALATEVGVDVFFQRDGTLAPRTRLATPEIAQVRIADLNGDGTEDIVANGGRYRGGIHVLWGTGGGGFAPWVSVANTNEFELEVADVTGDGRLDMVGCAATVNVFVQREDGSFASPVAYAGLPFGGCNGLAVGDLTGDGFFDVAVSGGGNRPSAEVAVFAQVVGGALALTTRLPSYDIPEPVEANDLTGDGRADLVTLHGGWSRAGVYTQQEDGTLAPEVLFPVGYASHYELQGLAVADVTGDRHPDLVLSDYGSGLTVLGNTTPTDPWWPTSTVPVTSSSTTTTTTTTTVPPTTTTTTTTVPPTTTTTVAPTTTTTKVPATTTTTTRKGKGPKPR
ncbi:MAG: FG-GAP repeat domain-containing protein, partial [Acidimicrobiales bacterium]